MFFFICFLLVSPIPLLSQTGQIKGNVKDAYTLEAIVSVPVQILSLKLGTVTNNQGEYLLKNIPVGTHVLTIRYIGYLEKKMSVNVKKNETIIADFKLSISEASTEEIEILGYNNTQELSDVKSSVTSIESSQIKTIPGGSKDLMHALTSMPGVQTSNDLSSQLIVRGAPPGQNLTLIDNIEFFSPYKLYGTFSSFNPEIVAKALLITGSFPAKYGDRLSSVLDVSNRAGNLTSAVKGSINANSYNANLVFEGSLSIFDKKSSWIVALRRSYIELVTYPLAKLINPSYIVPSEDFPNSTDCQLKFDLVFSEKNSIQLSGIFTLDALNANEVKKIDRIVQDSISSINNTLNIAIGTSWIYVPNPNIESVLSFSLYWYHTSFSFYNKAVGINSPLLVDYETTNSVSNTTIAKYSLKEELTLDIFENHHIEAGINVDIFYNDIRAALDLNDEKERSIRYQGGYGNEAYTTSGDVHTNILYIRASTYIQDKITLFSERLFIQPGIRFDYYGIIEKMYISPRLNLSIAANKKTTIRLGTGLYYQSPGYEKFINGSASIDFTRISPENLRALDAEGSIHATLGIEYAFNSHWIAKGELYLKTFHSLINAETHRFKTYKANYIGGDPFDLASWHDPIETYQVEKSHAVSNHETGMSYGFELLILKHAITNQLNNFLDRLDGWASYSFNISTRNDGSHTYPSPNNQIHNISFVLSYRVLDWLIIAARIKAATGVPYTRLEIAARATKEGIQVGDKDKKTVLLDLVYKNNKYSDRLPFYMRFDVRVAGLARFLGCNWIFYLDVINVFNNYNVIRYEYDPVKYQNNSLVLGTPIQALPFVPGFGITARF